VDKPKGAMHHNLNHMQWFCSIITPDSV